MATLTPELVAKNLEIISWAQATLTALNTGDVKSGSPLHLKLREVMVENRDEVREALES